MQRRNSNLKRRTRSEWNSELRGFMPEFSGRRTRQTDEKKGWWSVRCRAVDNDARRESTYRKSESFYCSVFVVTSFTGLELTFHRTWCISNSRVSRRNEMKDIPGTPRNLIRHAKLIEIIINRYWLIIVRLTLRFVYLHFKEIYSKNYFLTDKCYFSQKIRFEWGSMQI